MLIIHVIVQYSRKLLRIGALVLEKMLVLMIQWWGTLVHETVLLVQGVRNRKRIQQ